MSEFNKTVGSRIRKCRTEMGLTMKELGDRVNLSEGNIQRYETGKIKSLDANLLMEISDVLGVKPGYLMGWTNQKDNHCNYKLFPCSISAGVLENVEATNNYEMIAIADSIMGKYSGRSDIIILKVNGDSMNKTIPNQSLIVVDTRAKRVTDVNDGDIVVFSNFGEYSVKRFFNDKENQRFLFKPDSHNELFTTIEIKYELALDVRLIGKVVKYIVNLD